MSFPSKFPPMRAQLAIQLQHDRLMTLYANPDLLDAVVPKDYQPSLAMALDALCWVLHHDVDNEPKSHASDFARVLKDIEEIMDQLVGGFEPVPGVEYIVEE